MKVRAKLEKRPDYTKDCFDIYGYVTLIGIDKVAAAIVKAGGEGTTLMNQLDELFGDEDALGVDDVLAFVPDMYGDQYMLVRRAVMECFAELKRSVEQK